MKRLAIIALIALAAFTCGCSSSSSGSASATGEQLLSVTLDNPQDFTYRCVYFE